MENSNVCVEEDDDIKLIIEVEKYPIVWNHTLKEYKKNKQEKADAWMVIAKELQRDVSDIMYRWQYLRDSFVRKQKLKRSGKEEEEADWPVWMSHMEFLLQVVQHRPDRKNHLELSNRIDLSSGQNYFLFLQTSGHQPHFICLPSNSETEDYIRQNIDDVIVSDEPASNVSSTSGVHALTSTPQKVTESSAKRKRV